MKIKIGTFEFTIGADAIRRPKFAVATIRAKIERRSSLKFKRGYSKQPKVWIEPLDTNQEKIKWTPTL